MGAFSLVAVGCGSTGNMAGSGNVAPPAAPVAPVHSSLKRGVVFGLATNDGQRSIDIPIGTSPEVRAVQAKRLSKIQASPQVLRRELNTPSALEQRLASSDLNFSTFTTSRLKGPEPSIAYKQGSTQAAHNGITFSCSPMFAAGSHTLSAKFDFPGTGPLGVFPYLQVGDLFQSSSPNNRGAFASSQSGVTFEMTTFVNGDGTGTQEITLEGGTLYSGPLLGIVPWISSFQSGLHHAKVIIDGETVVDEDFIQRGLLLKDRLPQINSGQPDNIAVQTSFGWTEDDATVDDAISVDSPRWRAALGNSPGQAAGALSSSAWHDGNAVSFTIDNLRETLTKNLQPLTQVPIALRGKTYQSNKTLGYAVQAQALASFRYYDMTDSARVPGFRRDLILSNFQQIPLQAKPGTPVVFEFDINAINFESGIPAVNFGIGYDFETGNYAFFSHGELSEIDSGWHVRVPWTATPLSSTAGDLELTVSEASDSGKAAYLIQDFQVSLEQDVEPKAKVVLDDFSPEGVDITENQQLEVKATITSEGFRSADYSWKLFIQTEQGVDLREPVTGTGNQVSENVDLSSLLGQEISQVKVKIEATVMETDCTDPNHVLAKSEEACESATDDDDKLVAVRTRPVIQLDLDKSMLPSNLTAPSSGLSTIPIKVTFYGTAGVRESQVTLKLISQPGSGGHAHDNPLRPLGELAAVHSPTLAAGSSWSTTYTAPIVGGVTLIQATVDAQPVHRTTRPIIVEIPDLVELPPRMIRPDGTPLPGIPPYVLTGSLPAHPKNHFATYDTVQRLQSMALLNRQTDRDVTKLDETRIVYYNDMSLPRGGLFDIGPPYGSFWHPSHHEHRRGDIVDMQPGDSFLEEAIAAVGGSIHDEADHWHVRFGR